MAMVKSAGIWLASEMSELGGRYTQQSRALVEFEKQTETEQHSIIEWLEDIMREASKLEDT